MFRLVQTCFVRTGRVVTLTVSATKLNIPTTEGAFTWSVGENRSLDEFARFLCGRRAAPWALGARAASGLYAARAPPSTNLLLCHHAPLPPLLTFGTMQCFAVQIHDRLFSRGFHVRFVVSRNTKKSITNIWHQFSYLCIEIMQGEIQILQRLF